MKDPVGPGKGNQLPYLDGLKWLVILDPSTRLAALRTGKIDKMTEGAILREDFQTLSKTNPDIKYHRLLAQPTIMYLKTDTKPLDDIRVRRALNLAIDREAIARDYYGGDAQILSAPISPFKDLMAMYTPIEQLPDSAKERYTYQPDKAKQLLSEAGYPNGFKLSVLILADYADIMSILADYLSKVGVTLELDVKESGVYTSTRNGHKYQYAVVSSCAMVSVYYMRYWFPPGVSYNYCILNDPLLNEINSKIWAFENIGNDNERSRLVKQYSTYLISQNYYVDFPMPYTYNVWQPWIKNCFGISGLSVAGGDLDTRFYWIDQELKQKLGH